MTDLEKAIALQQLKHSQGYAVLLELMETKCLEAEGFCFGLDPVTCDPGSILAAHSRARAQREYKNSVIQTVDFLINEGKLRLEEIGASKHEEDRGTPDWSNSE